MNEAILQRLKSHLEQIGRKLSDPKTEPELRLLVINTLQDIGSITQEVAPYIGHHEDCSSIPRGECHCESEHVFDLLDGSARWLDLGEPLPPLLGPDSAWKACFGEKTPRELLGWRPERTPAQVVEQHLDALPYFQRLSLEGKQELMRLLQRHIMNKGLLPPTL